MEHRNTITTDADPASVNWFADEWFAKHYALGLTYDFQKWWVSFYGIPSDFSDDDVAQKVYWQRCAFALAGWSAASHRIVSRDVGS